MSSLRGDDYQAILGLCSEVAELTHPLDRARCFLQGCQTLCGADMAAIVAAEPRPDHYATQGGLMLGLSQDQLSQLEQWYFQGEEAADDPFNQALRLRDGATCRRRDVISDQVWYRHPQVAEGWSSVGLDDVMGSAVPLPHGHGILAVMRAWGSQPFNEQQRDIHHCLSTHFGWLLRGLQLSGYLGHQSEELPARLRAVLRQLLLGRTEKRVALELGLSPRTVNKYVEKLLRHYQVSSRAELMARWIWPVPAEPAETHPLTTL